MFLWQRTRPLSVLLLGSLALSVAPARAQLVEDVPWARMGQDLSNTRRPIAGSWGDEQAWDATLCEGHYRYAAAVNAVLTNVKFKLNEDGSLDARARIVDIVTRGNGSFRSWSTACVTVSGAFRVLAPWAEVDVRVFFDETDEGYTKIRLRVLRTTLGQLEVSDWVPDWAERVLTRALNRVLAWLWGSSLGNWISEKIGAVVVELIPNPAL
jgi:hypothetical protein